MADERMPFIAIIGGFWQLKETPAHAAAEELARQIGVELAKADVGLVVYFSDPESLEPYVVSGYVASLPAGASPDRIRVRFSDAQKDSVKFAEQATHGDLFTVKLFPGDDWEAPFYRSMVEADEVDGVVLMSGGRATLIAGQIAVARPLPVLAIDAFEGSARIIRKELATNAPGYPSSTTHTVAQMAGWLKEKCLARMKQRTETLDREQRSLHANSQKLRTAWAAGAFFALLTTVFFGLSKAPDPGYYAFLMFIGLIAAGATGATVRSVIWGAEGNAAVTSLLLGGVAGFVVGVAYLVPQWVTAPGVLQSTAKNVVEHTDKIQFISSILVAITAGVGFDTVFNRVKQQSADLAIGLGGTR